MNLSAVVLAGGKSSRMGRDKARLEIGGQPLLARQIQHLRSMGTGEIFISSRAGENYGEFGCPVLRDRFTAAGPLAGIERALAEASFSRLLVVAVDMPNLTPGTLKTLLEPGNEPMGVIPRVDGRIEPLAAIYPKAAWNLAVSLLENGIYPARTFAGRCVRDGLAVFYDYDVSAAPHFASWNLPADALSETV